MIKHLSNHFQKYKLSKLEQVANLTGHPWSAMWHDVIAFIIRRHDFDGSTLGNNSNHHYNHPVPSSNRCFIVNFRNAHLSFRELKWKCSDGSLLVPFHYIHFKGISVIFKASSLQVLFKLSICFDDRRICTF